MKIVNADWEIKNIGKVTVEITLEKSELNCITEDIIKSVLQTQKNYHAEYTVLKIPAGNPMVGVEFIKQGFWHIETQLNLKAMREDVESSLEKYAHLFCDTKIEYVEDLKGLKNIQTEIKKGIFSKDRISLDPHFDESVANNRYSNWLENEFNRGSQLFYIAMNQKKNRLFIVAI